MVHLHKVLVEEEYVSIDSLSINQGKVATTHYTNGVIACTFANGMSWFVEPQTCAHMGHSDTLHGTATWYIW